MNPFRISLTRLVLSLVTLALLPLSFLSCFPDETPPPHYGRVKVPSKQQFRWSHGGLPQVFDPALAAAPPDTDLIRAVFEGLTDYDPKTLKPVPGVAVRWESSPDSRVWTFYLRDDARWSNGERVTAQDFVSSWTRTIKLGNRAPHTNLMHNIEGVGSAVVSSANSEAGTSESAARLGVEALDEHILRVNLRRPDINFPALVAHPVFRPVKLPDTAPSQEDPKQVVSNGPFSVEQSDDERVLLKKAEHYWGRNDVALEQVEFVDTPDSEAALRAYRDGEVDAVTNAAFEPLAIKLLLPYEDFRRTTFGAVNYYIFNAAREPFDDVRVREALAIAIDRESISQNALGGSTKPARKFLPDEMTQSEQPVVVKPNLLEKNVERARELLREAGFPEGKGFPRVRLLINRNDQQRIVAEAIAVMWREALSIETEIVMKPWEEYSVALVTGEFDIARRGLVMQTTDEFTNMQMMFADTPAIASADSQNGDADEASTARTDVIATEEQALRQLKALPIYFASSYALVKPYVDGFDTNVLDAPSLKSVRINLGWRASDPSTTNR